MKLDSIEAKIASLRALLTIVDGSHEFTDEEEVCRQHLLEVIEFLGYINTPVLEDFAQGTISEALFQRAKWGPAQDRSKSAEQWFWLVGYLSGKALRASIEGNREKALHHTISSAAALANWHEAIVRDTSGAGCGEDMDMQRIAADLSHALVAEMIGNKRDSSDP